LFNCCFQRWNISFVSLKMTWINMGWFCFG
jgi:hypothetical protein